MALDVFKSTGRALLGQPSIFCGLLRLLALCACGLLASFALRGEEQPEAGVEVSAEEKAICELTNEERRKAGLGALQLNAKLFEAARAHAANMLKRGKMAHKLDGKEAPQRVAARGYKYSVVGENVAFGQETPEELVAAWMGSPIHRANILRKEFTEVGVGIARDKDGHPYYAQDFGSPETEEAKLPVRKVSFTISNETKRTVKVKLPGSDKSWELEPGETGVYTLSGAGEFAPAKVRVGKASMELKSEDGVQYVIQPTDGGFEVNKEEPVRTQSGGVE
jgi:hypothetical protein